MSPEHAMQDYLSRHFRNRRSLLLAAASVPISNTCGGLAATQSTQAASETSFRDLENSLDGRIGVFALDTGSGKRLAWRSTERFAMCSTFKAILAGAILERSTRDTGLLSQRIRYTGADLVTFSPITEQYTGVGMLVAELCAAAVRYSDDSFRLD